jgi:hypothetical protein
MTSNADSTAYRALRMIREAIEAADPVSIGPLPMGPLEDLLEMTASDDPRLARAGLSAIFPGLIEWLNDSFDPTAARYYTIIFSRIIEYYRRRPEGAVLDQTLAGFGLPDEAALQARFARIRAMAEVGLDDPGRLRRIICLSRVTIGADVAVTSVLIDGLRRAHPSCAKVEVVLVGSSKLGQLYGGDPRIRVREIGYERGGGLLGRLLSWVAVLAAIKAETSDLAPGEYLIVDPDSRLTQLGLLPLLQPEEEAVGYRFFPSREFRASGCSSLGELAAAWVAGVTGAKSSQGQAASFIAPPADFMRLGRAVVGRLREIGARRVTTVSLGVGGNEEKRVSERFEIELLRQLSGDGWVIVDQGFTAAEREQVASATAPRRAAGMPVVAASEELDELPDLEASPYGILTWEGGIGSLAGLIAASDAYVGYDSSGQHLAAALEVPGKTIFVSDNPPLFAARWAPYGRQSVVVRCERD